MSKMNKTGATGCKIPKRNVWADSLPEHGFVSLEPVGSNHVYVWHGHRRGTGRERAVICWGSQSAYYQGVLNDLVTKFKKYGHMTHPFDFNYHFGVNP